MILGLIDSHISSGLNTQVKRQRRSSHGDQTLQVLRTSYFEWSGQALNFEHLGLVSIPDQENIFYHLLDGVDQLISKEVRVICMPIGFTKPSPLLETLVNTIERHDILLVAPSGNKGEGTVTYPGKYPSVICVGAIDQQRAVASFSGSSLDEQGNCFKPDVAAEGVHVPVKIERELPQVVNGTSLACAKVAGLLAAMIETNPVATSEQLRSALYGSGVPSESSRFGRINARQAMNLVKQTQPAEKKLNPAVNLSFTKSWIDPRLEYQCMEALKGGREVAALVSGSGEVLPERHGISSMKTFKNFDISHVVANAAFYDMLFDRPDLKWASAVDINYFDL